MKMTCIHSYADDCHEQLLQRSIVIARERIAGIADCNLFTLRFLKEIQYGDGGSDKISIKLILPASSCLRIH